MMKNTIITFLLIIIAALAFLLYKSKNENYRAQQVITEIRQDLDEAKDELKAQGVRIGHEFNEAGNIIKGNAEKIKSDLKK